MSKLSIVIPAFNEEDHIVSVVDELIEKKPLLLSGTQLQDIEIIVINDGSTDQTGRRLQEYSQSAKASFQVITHEVNRGYGAALKTGFENSTGEYLSFMDGDGTIDPISFISMYQTLKENEYDMVVGTRFERSDSEMPILRKVGNKFFAHLLSFLSGERVKDTASGMRLFRRSIVKQLLPLPDGLHFTPAMSAKAVHEKIRIGEISIPYAERQGKSKLNVVSDGIRFLKIILGTVLLYNPFKVFLLAGLFLEMIAAILLSIPVYVLFSGEDIQFSDYIYRSIGALYFSIAGVQIILFGILARFMVSTFFRSFEREQWIHRLNDRIKIYDRMAWYGVSVFIVGIAINGLYFARFLFGRGIHVHWAILLFAAAFIIVGLQMMITGVIMKILRDIKLARGID